ncbi:MAG: hypothetical protein ABR615_09255 [Pseudonocardiaceae bacterium]
MRVLGAGPRGGIGPAIARDVGGDHELAERICRACVLGLDVDCAAISLLTACISRETVFAT